VVGRELHGGDMTTSTDFDEASDRIETLPLAELVTAPALNPRERTPAEIVAGYSERMIEGDDLRPLLVYSDGDRFLLVDGHLRLEAARLAGHETIRCRVRRGRMRDALLASAGVNAEHGLPRTCNDKRRAVRKLLEDPEWSQWSDRQIARHCKVSPSFVGQQRGLTVNVDSDAARKFVTRHGGEAVMNITALRGEARPEPSGKPVSLSHPSEPERTAEVVNLASEAESRLQHVVAAVAAVERLVQELPPAVTLPRTYGSRDALALRFGVIGQRCLDYSAGLKRKEPRRA